MKELKASLLVMGKEVGDSGTSEMQSQWIDSFLSCLSALLTERMLITFSAFHIRKLYETWMAHLAQKTMGNDERLDLLASLIWTASLPRELPELEDPGNVVSIFSKA